MDTLHEERIHLVGTNYIGYIDWATVNCFVAHGQLTERREFGVV